MQVIKELMDFVTAGTRVFYIPGNHDEMLRRYTDLHMGNFTLTDKLVMEIDHRMVWILHGDVFDNTTKGSAARKKNYRCYPVGYQCQVRVSSPNVKKLLPNCILPIRPVLTLFLLKFRIWPSIRS